MAKGDEFIFDPKTGVGEFRAIGYEPVVGHVSEFFDGRFTGTNYRLADMTKRDASGRFTEPPIVLGQAGLASLMELEDNRFDIISTTSRGVANRQLGNNVLRMVSGTIDTLGADGEPVSFDIAPIPINNIDHTWVAYLQNDDTEAFANVHGTYASTSEVQREWGPAYRLATPEEAAAQSIMKRLYMDNIDEVRKFAEDNDILDENGNADLSGAIREIMRIADYSGLAYFARSVLE